MLCYGSISGICRAIYARQLQWHSNVQGLVRLRFAVMEIMIIMFLFHFKCYKQRKNDYESPHSVNSYSQCALIFELMTTLHP